MFCPDCGQELKQSIFCTNCGTELPIGSKFCSKCGVANQQNNQNNTNGNNFFSVTPSMPVNI